MIRLGEVLDDLRRAPEGAPRRFVHVDCRSKKTRTEWTHIVDEQSADETARSIERRWPDVKATVRR